MSGEPSRTLYCSRCLTTFPGDADRCPNLGCRSGRPKAGWGELLGPGQIVDRTYRVHKMLAIGGAGVTYLGAEVGPDGQGEIGPRLAIKVLYQQRDQGPYLRRLATEAQILQGLNHPNIVECRGFVHRTGHSPYLVTRFMEGGSLLDHMRRVGTLPVAAAAGVARQVCWALEVAHRQGVVHRDLKPENVLLEGAVAREQAPIVRVADFGIAKVYGGVGERLTRVGAFVGTPQYAAPEQFDGLAPEPATDVYAVGALFHFCVTGRHVADFMAELEPESQKEHLLRHLPPRVGDAVPSAQRRAVEDTLAVAMAVDPGDRCDIALLEARLAALAEGRDPGYVRLPPAPVVAPPLPPGAATLGGSLSEDTLYGKVAPLPPPLPPDAHAGPPGVAGPAGHVGAVRSEGIDAMPPAGAGPSAERAPSDAPTADRPNGARSTDTLQGPPRTVSASFGTGDALRLPPERTLDVVPHARSRFGCVFAVLGLGGVGAVAAAAVASLVLWPAPVTLTGQEGDAAQARDWSLVAGTLGKEGVAAERACGAPPYQSVEVVVEADGTLREARLLEYDHEPTRTCIEGQLRKVRFPRAGDYAARVAVKLQR